MWRLVLDKIATLEEIETHWSFDDLMRANAILNMQSEISLDLQRKAQSGRTRANY